MTQWWRDGAGHAPDLPWSQACENNKEPILERLREHFAASTRVLEIGSGTGQHAVHFAPSLPHLTWIASDLAAHHDGIRAWIAHRPAPNIEGPILLDAGEPAWPRTGADAAFSANTAHIMHWGQVRSMVRGVAGLLPRGGVFVLYGPFRYGERHTGPGNLQFDASLRARDPGMGIRDAHALDAVAAAAGLALVADHPMPADNRTRVWRRE